MVTKCSFCHTFTDASTQNISLKKVVKEYALIKVIIWSQNVQFVTNVTVTGTGGLYPRVRDFFIYRNGVKI